ncbi:MAG: hypothetical protein RBT41_08580 [Clostridia bacterium]|nr:hypothetical protein [Clostridia bacterium]
MDIKRDSSGDNLANLTQQISVAKSAHSVIKTIVFAAILTVVALFLMYLGVPWFIWTAMLLVAAGVVVLDVLTLKRTAGVDLNTLSKPISENVGLEPGESLTDTIPAVMQYGKARSTAVLGVGQVHTPENALLITDRAVWAMTVPLLGADKVVAGRDIGMDQFMFAYKDIGAKLQEMVATLPLEEVLKQGRAQRLMRLEEIQNAKTFPFSQNISLKRTDGKKFGYSIRVKEDYLKAKKIFKIS